MGSESSARRVEQKKQDSAIARAAHVRSTVPQGIEIFGVVRRDLGDARMTDKLEDD